MGLNLLTTLARNLLTGGTPQQPATIQREAEQLPITRIADVNAAVSEQQGEPTAVTREALGELSAAETTAPPVATTISTTIPAPTDAVDINNPTKATPPAVKLEFSQAAVDSLRPIFSALTDLFKSVLPELNLQQLAATAKAVLQALSQVSSNPADAQATAATPA